MMKDFMDYTKMCQSLFSWLWVKLVVMGVVRSMTYSRCLRIGILQTSNGGKNLGQSNQKISWSLNSNVNVVRSICSIRLKSRGTSSRSLVARARRVNQLLHTSSVSHGECSKVETPCDSGDGLELDSNLAKTWVEDVVADRDENDDGYGVDVLHNVVGNAMQLHGSGLRNEVVQHLRVNDPVDWVEGEDFASNNCTLDLFDEDAVPFQLVLAASNFLLVLGLGGIEVALVHDTDPDDLESLGNDRSLGWLGDILVLANQQGCETEQKEQKGQEVGWPEPNILLKLSSGNRGKRTNVDHEVEYHVDPLDSCCGINNDSFSRLQGLDIRCGVRVLLGNKRRHIRFNATSSKTNDQHCCNKTTQSSTIFNSNGQRCQEKNQVADNVDDGKVENRPILSEILICDNSSEDRSNVAPNRRISTNLNVLLESRRKS